jgi:hypothetical protein
MKSFKLMMAVLATAATGLAIAQTPPQDPSRPKTRDEVRAEVDKARTDGTLMQFNGEGSPQYRTRADGTAKTNDELKTRSAELK